MRKRIHPIISFGAAVALLALPGGTQAGSASTFHAQDVPVPDTGDPEALPFAAGPNLLLGDHWYKFDTDACGLLQRMDSHRSMTVRGQFDDDGFADEDPSDDARNIISQWLSTHSDVAVISDGVDKWCGEDWFDDEEQPSESIA